MFIEKLMKIAEGEAIKEGLNTPEGSYYKCSQFCGILLASADQLGIPGLELYGCKVKYPKTANYADEKGKLAGHYVIKAGNTIYDFTLRQFIPDSEFPYISELESSKIYKDLRPAYESHVNHVYDIANEDTINRIIEKFREK